MSIEQDIASIIVQEATLMLTNFGPDLAWQLGGMLREFGVARQVPLVIDIRRIGSPHQPLFYTALAGSTPDNARWVQRKVNVVSRFHKSSYHVGRLLEQQKMTFMERYGLSDEDYAPHGGGFPLNVAGTGVVGCVTVSGLPQREDHNLVVEALCKLTDRDHEALRLKD